MTPVQGRTRDAGTAVPNRAEAESPGRAAPTDDGHAPLIVGLGGTNRTGSTSERALRIALDRAATGGCRTELIVGALLDLPSYDPGRPQRTPSARRLIDLLRRADGVIVATPSYHGGFSGLIKNALDYVEDMRDDPRPYLDGRAVGIIVTAYGAQGLGTAMTAMRSVVHALRAWPTPYGAAINSTAQPFGEDGPAPDVLAQVARVADQVVDFATMRRRHETMLRDKGG